MQPIASNLHHKLNSRVVERAIADMLARQSPFKDKEVFQAPVVGQFIGHYLDYLLGLNDSLQFDAHKVAVRAALGKNQGKYFMHRVITEADRVISQQIGRPARTV